MNLPFNPLLFDLCRLRTDYNSEYLLNAINETKRTVRFSYGFNEGRNRRELLALYPKRSVSFEHLESFISLSGLSDDEGNNYLSESFLRGARRRNNDGKYYLDLRGTLIEKNFNRRIVDTDLESLFEFIKKRPNICGLHLAYNSITKNGFNKLSEFFAEHSTINYVNVMNNEIKQLDQRKLLEDVGKWNVRCLNLRGNKLGDKGGEVLAELLVNNTSLRHLAIGETDQTVNSVMSILDVLIQFGGNESLTKLDLTKTFVGNNCSAMCRRLACVLEVNRSLIELVLSKNEISDKDLEILLEGLKYPNVLSRLNLSCNRISSLGAEFIANILPLTDIKLLVLSTNMIGDSGAMALGRTFSLNKLTFLDISVNKIGDKGITHLVWGICRPMDGFFIFGNTFSEYGMKVIYSQVLDLALNPKTMDIHIWFDSDGKIRHTRRDLRRYSDWYYYVPEWDVEYVIEHCCCPIRGGVMIQLKTDDC